MIIKKLRVIYFIVIASTLPWHGACYEHEPQQTLWRIYSTATCAANRVVPLLAYAMISRHAEEASADSMFVAAQQESALSGSDTLLSLVYTNYLSTEDFENEALASEFISALIQLGNHVSASKWLCSAYSAQARLYLKSGNYSNAAYAAKQASSYAGIDGDAIQKAHVWILQGIIAEYQKAGLEAFRRYLSALYLAEESESDDLRLLCYERLSEFYAGIRDYDKAIQLKLKQIELYRSVSPYDTAGYMDQKTVLGADYFYDAKPLIANAVMHQALSYARGKASSELASSALEIWRSTLISLDQIPAVEDLYTRQYPDELKALETNDVLTFYRLKAYFSELHGDNTAARKYYVLAEDRILSSGRDSTYQANFYRRYGQFLVRSKNYPAAGQVLLKAQGLNEQAHYLPYAVSISALLDSVYKMQGKDAEAYKYARLTAQYQAEQSAAEQQDKLLLLELDHEARTRKLEQDREEDARHRRHSLQYMGIMLIILSLFTVLVLLGSFKPRRWIIRAVGFISFIMLFEFIILLLDHRIAEITHEEPWKMLGIKIIVIAFLLPFHHWAEEKAVHYLYVHPLTISGKLLRRRKSPVRPAATEVRQTPEDMV